MERSARVTTRRFLHEIELLVFLSLLVPSLVLSLVVAGGEDGSFALVAIATILRDASLVALVLYFLWRNQEPFDRVGLGASAFGREALLGVVLFVPVSAAAGGLALGLQALGLSAPTRAPPALTLSHAQMVLAVVLVAVVAVAEETIFRGYVLHRLREWTGNTSLSVLLSAALFAIGHGYEGAAGMITVGFLGIVFAVVYLWRGSLAAPMVMHFCQDLVAVVLVPSLLHRG
jgi:membrane protease YdiL (CAAX protease family)